MSRISNAGITDIFHKAEKHRFLLSIFIVSILFLLSLTVFESTWAINDDVMMAMDASGKGFSSRPTEYIFSSNIILGHALKNLYQLMPSYPWYGLYTVLVLFISFVVLMYSLLKYKFSVTRIFYFFIFFIFYGLWLIRTPQFTTNAFILGMSGVFLLLADLYEEKATLSWRILLASLFLLTLSFLIRIDSFFFVLVLSFPSFVAGITKKNFSRPVIRRLLLFFVSLVLTVSACYFYNRTSYLKDDRWTYQLEKTKLLVEMVDNKRAYEYSRKTKHIFDEAGWSLNDFLLVNKWFSADDKEFSKGKLTEILTGFQSVHVKRPMIHFRSMFGDVYFYGAILLAIFFVIQRKEKKNTGGMAVNVILALGIMIYLGYYVRLPKRIYLPILSSVSFLALFFADREMNFKTILNDEWKTQSKFIFIVLFLGYFLFFNYSINLYQRAGNQMLKYYMAQLHPTKDRVFLVWANSLPLELISIFDNLDDFSAMKMLPTSQHFNSPVSEEVLKKFDARTFGDLVEKDNLYHIGNQMYMALYSRYLKEHYGLDVAFKICTENPLFKVYKNVTITPEMKDKLLTVPVNVNDGIIYSVMIMQEGSCS